MTEDQNVNRKIAEKLGWTAIRDVTVWVDGDKVGKVPIHGHSGINPQNGEREVIPDYTHSLDVAWSLFTALPPDVTPRLVRVLAPQGKIAYIHRACIITDRWDFEVEHDDPATAVCEVWLKWKASQP